jgi:hypothetical protein
MHPEFKEPTPQQLQQLKELAFRIMVENNPHLIPVFHKAIRIQQQTERLEREAIERALAAQPGE